MGIYVVQMFNSQAESTTLTDMNSGTTAAVGAFSPVLSGKLLKVIVMWAGEAVSSLIENVRVELSSTLWDPNKMEFGLVGANIRTAPAFPISPFEYVVDQPVRTDHPITGQIIYDNTVTPVTCNLKVYGVFSG